MNKLQSKILTALKTNKLNPTKLGERKWYNYLISVDELFWARNFVDGYSIDIYSDDYKTKHLATFILTYDFIKNEIVNNLQRVIQENLTINHNFQCEPI